MLVCCWTILTLYINGLVQDCSISIANTLEILQSCIKPSISTAMGLSCWLKSSGRNIRDHFVNAFSQWEMTLHCNVVSHWLEAYTKWSLYQNMVHDNTRMMKLHDRSDLSLWWVYGEFAAKDSSINILASVCDKVWYLQHNCVGDTIVYCYASKIMMT